MTDGACRKQRATLGDICICKMSNHLDILQEARNRLEQCEKLDRTVPIDLPEMDQQQSFLKWAHVQIRAGVSLSQISIILCTELTVTSTFLRL